MKKYLLLIFLLLFTMAAPAQEFRTPFEKSDSLDTALYDEAIAYFQKLDREFEQIKLLEYGITDAGKPLHLVVISKNKEFDPAKLKAQKKTVLLVNNAIHPGESCGVDASMMLARDLMQKKELNELLENVVVAIIPIYNVGGALNQNCCTRANQVGPESQGFRGNAKNLDLNRDFIKMDSRNAQAFAKIFHSWRPDIFVDTHTSNGADYQHVMTLISTQKDKLHPTLSKYLQQELEPKLFSEMKKADFPMTPYVYSKNYGPPDSGLIGFLETSRYSTGYAALFNTIGFTTEAHMLKPYKERVMGTYEFLRILTEKMNKDYISILELRNIANTQTAVQNKYILDWKLDTINYSEIEFLGYEATMIPSKVSGLPVLHYDQTKPWKRKIKYYNNYFPANEVTAPVAYIIPQAWQDVIERLEINNIDIYLLENDTVMEAEIYYIENYSTTTYPYEGHYLHYNTKVAPEFQEIQFYKGDYIIPVNQKANRYIVETLEPTAPDSYFNWNFFDPILMQKEYFSDYVFDAVAAELLKENKVLREQFDEKMEIDSTFAQDIEAQLQFIYKRSPYYEKSHRRYPVARIIKK